jgi:hypothetical protein
MAKYALMIMFKNETTKEDVEFVNKFLYKYQYTIAYGSGYVFLYHPVEDGADPLIAISGRIPDSVMRHIGKIAVMRITEIVDVTKTIGVNNICR